MPKKRIKKKVEDSINKDDTKLYAFLATFLSVVGFVIALFTKKEDKYVMFYAKQSLVIFITAVFVNILAWLIMWIPIIGKIINFVLWAFIIILWILSWVNALSGEMKETPFVGGYAYKIKL
mgnify:CR=1 FL=1